MAGFIEREFDRIREAFRRFKLDINLIKKEIEDLKSSKNLDKNLYNKEFKEIEKLREEIKFLKKVIYSMQTKEEVIMDSEKEEIIGNKITLKFHYSSCPFTKRISPENMIIFSTLEDARKKGYSSCSCITTKK